MFRKLKSNMLLFNVITVSLVMLTAFAVIYFVTYGTYERENERKLEALYVPAIIQSRPIPAVIYGRNTESNRTEAAPEQRFSADYSVSFTIFSIDGKIEQIISLLDFDRAVYEQALAKAESSDGGEITLEGRRWKFKVIETPLLDMGILGHTAENLNRTAFLDITNTVRAMNNLLLTLICVGVAVLAVLIVFSYRFSVRAVRPIEESYMKQKQFVADASHELRTPISVISANVDAIEMNADETVESQSEWFGYIRAEIKRTEKLVGDLLYLAKAESSPTENNVPFDLSVMCETACALMEAVLYERGISLDTEIERGITLTSDGEKINQVLYILLDNAGKYTPENGRIAVSLRRMNDRAALRVSNTGEGIPKADLEKIFDRFYRPDASRSQETGGFGLGLSIAKTIVERSNGEISAESDGGLTTFTVKLKV
jgi:Signal transduction histidine kinase